MKSVDHSRACPTIEISIAASVEIVELDLTGSTKPGIHSELLPPKQGDMVKRRKRWTDAITVVRA